MNFSQAPAAVLMIRPQSFGFNDQTAATNVFQKQTNADFKTVSEQALHEFDTMVDMLRSNDIDVVVVEDSDQPPKPDAIFPNNWISFHHDGSVVLYPMLAENRRAERSIPALAAIKKDFVVQKTIDITGYEQQGKFLEGTGSIVFDYAHKLAYASRSSRTHEQALEDICEKLDFKPVVFDAVDELGQPIYHTNVIMCIGSEFITICLDAIKNESDHDNLLDSFSRTGRKVIAISYPQLKMFAGNMMEVQAKSGESVVLLSEQAFHSLLPGQLDAISKFAEPLPLKIPTIEQYGGGSVRCMVAGIFNPAR